MKSRIDFTGSCGFTMTTRPLVAISPTGAKSFTGSNGMVLPRSAGVVPNDVAVTRSVSPSAGAFATKSAPMLPVAPGLLSTTIGTFRRSDSFGPSTRERMSAPVPGVKGTTTWIGRLGHESCACAATALRSRNSGIRKRSIRLLWKHMSASPLVLNEPQAFRFEVNRAALVDPEIFAREREKVFERCWLYVGHESEVREPGDFRTRVVCGRPVLFCRDSQNELRVFLNTCRHRGAVVCREAEGNAKRFTCFYHGWTYDRDGKLYAIPGQDAYPPNFDRAQYGLQPPPRVDSYRGLVFLNFDRAAVPLADYLGKAREYIDLVLDQSPSGRMEVIHGTQDYDIKANWKLLVENSFDDYHLITTHATWLDYLKNSGVQVKKPEKGHVLPSHGLGKDLGNGHGTTDNVNFRGRPVAAWIPIYGDA